MVANIYLFRISSGRDVRGLLLIVLACYITYGACEPTEHPTIQGRYTDEIAINVLAGNDGVLDYTLPAVVLPVRIITVDKVGGRFLGSCSPRSVTEPCNRTTEEVIFVNGSSGPYVVLRNVTVADTGKYQIRTTRQDDKPVNPNHLDLFATMTVFSEEALNLKFGVPNVFDPVMFNPLEDPVIMNASNAEFQRNQVYTLNVDMERGAPLANVTITQIAGTAETSSVCTESSVRCSHSIQFNGTRGDEVWKVRILVKFDIQNVEEAMAEFLVVAKAEQDFNPIIAVGIVVAVIAVAAGVGVIVYFSRQLGKRKSIHRKEYMNRVEPVELSQHKVPVSKLAVAEYVYQVDVQEKTNSSEYQRKLVVVVKLCTALMNTSGGVIVCTTGSNLKYKHSWLKVFKIYFSEVVGFKYESVFADNIRNGDCVLYVKKINKIVYLKCGDDLATSKKRLTYFVEDDGDVYCDLNAGSDVLTNEPKIATLEKSSDSVAINIDTDIPNYDETATASDRLLFANGQVQYTAEANNVSTAGNPDIKRIKEKTHMSERSPKENRRRNKWYRESQMIGTTQGALQDQVLSWTKNSFDWTFDPNERQSSATFRLSSPVTFVPSKYTTASFGRSSERDAILRRLGEIEKMFDEEKGCVIYLQTTDGAIELLLLHENDDPQFVFIPSKANTHPGVEKHSSEACRILKKKLCLKMAGMKYFLRKDSPKTLSFVIRRTPSVEENTSTNTCLLPNDLEPLSATGQLPVINQLNESLYALMASKYAAIQYRLGDEKLSKLAERKVLSMYNKNATFNYIEGPPGSGKSLLAYEIYMKELQSHRVQYCCPTKGFKAFLCSKGIDERNIKIVNNDEHLEELPFALDDYDVIIIDDMQRVECKRPENWSSIFEAISKLKKKLYIFADSKYQNYHRSLGDDYVKDTMVGFCEKNDIAHYTETLTEVFRNSKKVFSFLKGNLTEDNADITCHHDEYGDDVLVCHLRNTDKLVPTNGILKLVKGLLGQEVIGRVYEHNVTYSAAEIAIIVGGDEAEKDRKFLVDLLTRPGHLTEVDVTDATVYDKPGLVVETAENYCGLERPVCIFYPGSSRSEMSTIESERYKTYVASRGINLVIFIETSDMMTLEKADKLNMGKLENIVLDNCSHWKTRDVHAIVESINHAEKDEDILGLLSSIAAKIGEKDVAETFIEHHGIPIAHRRINKSENEEIRERALMTLTAVALHDNTCARLVRDDVIEVACRSLKSEWAPEWWEAAYLLGHLLQKGASNWDDRHPTRQQVIETLNAHLEKRDKRNIWKKDKTSAVAHGEIDYETYNTWLAPDQLPVLQYLAMLSLCNLVLSKGGMECYNLENHIGIKKIAEVTEDSRYELKVQQLASKTLRAFDKTKIVPGAFDRDYA